MSTIERESIHKAEFGTIDYYADLIRDNAPRWGDIGPCALGVIRAAVITGTATDAERVEWVRNAIAATDIVRAELQAARR